MHRLLFFPLCIIRGFCFPVLAVGALVATIAYVANKVEAET